MRHVQWLRLLAATSTIAPALMGGGPSRADARAETYVVRPNDTLSGIALVFGTTVPALMAVNHLTNADGISVGQLLLIWSDGPSRGYRHRRHDTEGAPRYRGVGGAVGAANATSLVYIVRPGDTLSEIGLRFGISPAALVAANASAVLSPLIAGQRLIVPAPVAGVGGPPAAPGQGSISTTPIASPTPAPGSGVAATPAPAVPQAGQARSIEALLTAQAQAAGVSVALVKAVAWQESGWRMVTAADGGIGVMQLMPATVDWLSTSVLGYRLNPYDAADNIRGGVALLAYYLRVFGGNQQLAVAAYHQGLASVQGQGINANTAGYVANVLALEQRFTS
jgi:LysM repeat protein